MYGYDLETTGLDFWHGCRPFAGALVSEEETHYWQWDVNPCTRSPVGIKTQNPGPYINILKTAPIVGHNVGFDMRGTDFIWPDPDWEWNWDAIEDTLLASHALRNLWPHDLKTLRSVFLLYNSTSTDYLREAVKAARKIVRRKEFMVEYGSWRIAENGDPHWPGITTAPSKGWWVCDMWLPDAIRLHAPEFLPPENLWHRPGQENYFHHPWETLVEYYCTEDAASTLVLWHILAAALKEEGLWEQYLERKEVLRVCYNLETEGVNLLANLPREVARYQRRADAARSVAQEIAESLGFPEANLNSSPQLSKILFGGLKLRSPKRTPGGAASTDAEVLEKLLGQQKSGPAKAFLENLLLCRRNEKAAQYLVSYQKWSTSHGFSNLNTGTEDAQQQAVGESPDQTGIRHVPQSPTQGNHHPISRRDGSTLHCNYHVTGTKFTRQSSSNPNLQNVGTGKEEDGELDYQLRTVFGPRAGRCWFSWDYSNIELRIWAYLCGNQEFINSFERGESIHLLIARELHPRLTLLSDDEAKAQKDYKKTKNGNFAVVYGATPNRADLTYGVPGAYVRIIRRFPEVQTFTQQLYQEVQQRGYITTLTGYRLYIPPDDPHKAVSGKVQGTAGSIIGRAMVATQGFLEANYPAGRLILQVHDELVFDMPPDPPSWVFRGIEKSMTQLGEGIGIPLEVSGYRIPRNWAENIPLKD